MPIQQTKKDSDLEKRLKILRQQVYGKEKRWEMRNEKVEKEVGSEKSHLTPQSPISHIPHPISTAEPFRTDVTYLNQDLLKIFILATFALGAQIILFYLVQNNILNLNLF